MTEMKVSVGKDAQILKRMATAAFQMAVGGGFALSQASGFIIESRVTTSPTAEIAVIGVAPLLLDSVSQEVRDFIDAHNLKSDLSRTIQLIYNYFPPGVVISLQVETDPEAEDKCLVVDAKTGSGAKAALQAYNGFVKEWVADFPPSVRDDVRVTFNLS